MEGIDLRLVPVEISWFYLDPNKANRYYNDTEKNDYLPELNVPLWMIACLCEENFIKVV